MPAPGGAVNVAVPAGPCTIVPALAEKFTANGAPENMAIKVCMRVPVLTKVTDCGDNANDETVTVAESLIAEFPLTDAVTVKVPEVAGAVKVAEFPEVEIVPPVVENTGVNGVPAGLIVAVNMVCVPERSVAVVGVIEMAATTTVAVAVLVGSEILVAVTVNMPVVAGALNTIELAGDPDGAAVNVAVVGLTV